jgi:hypothetical protein
MQFIVMSRTYDLTTLSGVLRQIAKTKGVNWSASSTVDGKKAAPLASLKNPQASKLAFVARVLGINVSDIFLALENPAHIDTLPGPPQPEVIQEDGGTPVTGESGGDPVIGVQEDGGTPVTP